MKRNLQEQEWAKKLKEWEASTSSQTWERPAAGGWDRIAESLPSNEKKPLFIWRKMSLLVLVLIGIGGGFYSYSSQKSDLNTDFNENNLTQGNSVKEVDAANKETFVSSTMLTNKENQKAEQSNELEEVPSNSVNNSFHNPKYTTEPNEVQHSKIGKQPTSTTIDIRQKNKSELNKTKTGLPQVLIENDDKSLEVSASPSSKIASKLDVPKTKTKHNLPLLAIELPVNVVSNNESELIPTLAFGVQAKDIDLGVQPSLNKAKNALWAIDVYAQYSFQSSFYNFSPLWSLQKATEGHHKNKRNQSYGIQVKRTLGKGFSAHIGIQQQNHFYINKGQFRRKFNTVDEDNMRRTTYQFSTAVNEDKNIEEDVKIVRNSGEPVPSGITLRFKVERAISVETSSIPIGISYTFFQSYPFQLSGVFGGEYSRIKTQSKLTHLSILHQGFRVEQINARNRGNETIVSSDFSLQAGLRLDVYLTPSIKALVQLDWQNIKTQKTPGPLLGTGNQMRFGLSYDL